METSIDLSRIIDYTIRIWDGDPDAYRCTKPSPGTVDVIVHTFGLPYGTCGYILTNVWYERYTERSEAEQKAFDYYRAKRTANGG